MKTFKDYLEEIISSDSVLRAKQKRDRDRRLYNKAREMQGPGKFFKTPKQMDKHLKGLKSKHNQIRKQQAKYLLSKRAGKKGPDSPLNAPRTGWNHTPSYKTDGGTG